MPNIAERLKRLRNQAGLTQGQLARLSHVTQATLSRIEKGVFTPKEGTCKKITDALGLPADALVDLPPGTPYDNPQPLITRKLPLLGEIPCGIPAESWEVVEWVDVLSHQWGPNRYMLRASGDSMSPIILNRDLILIENGGGLTLEDADHKICALEYDGEKTLKYVDVEWRNSRPVKAVLRPRNDRYKPIEILGTQLDRLMICGIALSIQRNL